MLKSAATQAAFLALIQRVDASDGELSRSELFDAIDEIGDAFHLNERGRQLLLSEWFDLKDQEEEGGRTHATV